MNASAQDRTRSTYHYGYSGDLIAPPYPQQAVLARNHIFPLNTEYDYHIQAQLDTLPARRSFVLPSVLYQLIRDLLRQMHETGLEFDMILIRLGAPILENMPDELLAANVFISTNTDALIDLAHQQGCRRILCIEHDFLMHYVNDFGDNSFGLSLYYDDDLTNDLDALSTFLKGRNILGEFKCLSR